MNNNNTKKQLPNKNIFLIAYRPLIGPTIHMECTCGYSNKEVRKKERNSSLIKECPDCGVPKYENLNSSREYTISRIYEQDINKEKAIFKHMKVDIVYKQSDKSTKEDTFEIKTTYTDFVIGYETNKKGVKVFKPKRIVKTKDGETTYKLLKSDLEYHYNGTLQGGIFSNTDLHSASYTHNGFASVIWGIHNRYKYGYQSMQKGFMHGYFDNIDSVKNFNKMIQEIPQENVDCMLKHFDIEANHSRTRISVERTLREFNNLLQDKKDLEKLNEYLDIKKKVLSNEMDLQRRVPVNVTSYCDEFTDLLFEYGFSVEDIIELFAHAERQAFDLRTIFTSFMRVCSLYKEVGIEIDKKPREFAIYMAKSRSLLDMACYHIVNRKGTLTDKDDNSYNLGYYSSKEVLKTVYELYGFKGVNELLIAYNMNDIKPFKINLKLDETVKDLDIIGFAEIKRTYYYSGQEEILPSTLLLPDGTIVNDAKEIANMLIEKSKEVTLKGEEATC